MASDADVAGLESAEHNLLGGCNIDPKNELDSRSMIELSSKASEQHRQSENLQLEFRDIEKDLNVSKKDDERLIELIRNRIEHTNKTRHLIETTVTELEAVQNDENANLTKYNRSAKIERREATSLRTQWTDLHNKAEESRRKYKEKYSLALENLNKARALITKLADEEESQTSEPSPLIINDIDKRTSEECQALYLFTADSF